MALTRGMSLEDMCVVSDWASPHTSIKFYNVDNVDVLAVSIKCYPCQSVLSVSQAGK